LPNGITAEAIGIAQIPSILRNPDIAHVLYLRGFMEKAGRGGVLIRRVFKERGLPVPEWHSDDYGVTLTFFAPEVTPEVTPEVIYILEHIKGEMTRVELQILLDKKDDDYFREKYLLPALEFGVIERTIPDKPTSSKQKYRITSLGKKLLEKI